MFLFDHTVIIVVDDLGIDKVGAYAGDAPNPDETRPATPTMDLIAAAGVRFTDAWANPVCSPTRATLYSGNYAYRHGVGTAITSGSSTRLPTTSASIGKLASDAGLKTALFGKWHVGTTARTLSAPGTTYGYKEYPVQVGFQYFAGNMADDFDSYTDWLYTVSAPISATSTKYKTTATQTTSNATVQTTSDALAWASSNASQRRLSVIAYNLAHSTPNCAGADWEDAASSCGATPTSDLEDQRVAVECVDVAIEDLLLGLPDLENTLVVFLGDNGTPSNVTEGLFDDHRGKGTLYESGVRVPFVVADGAAIKDLLETGEAGGSYVIDPGGTVSSPVGAVDVFATVAEYLSLSSSGCSVGSTCALDSQSLGPVLDGEAPARDDMWTEGFTKGSSTYTGTGALRMEDTKLIVSVKTSGCPTYELYDLAVDRWEGTNLFDDPAYADVQATLLARLEEHRAAMTYAWLTSCS